MKITYIVESTPGYGVIGYARTLGEAKRLVFKVPKGRIIKVMGPNFGEGFHSYYLDWDGERFTRTKVRG